ncbi:hypothetical protein FRC04_003852 [Tulasnella sp. 424]|nr:hypothetical protein FRC04_003852 [Tulasnella sp. 424]KAG8975351.1 hypothetical protein FRC05_005910 [Tulasnella sp. 425]
MRTTVVRETLRRVRICRAKTRSRPVQVSAVKRSSKCRVGIKPKEEPALLPGPVATALVLVASDDPWHGIFRDADDDEAQEVEDYYIGHDDVNLDVFEAPAVDFDLDGYCGAPADFGHPDEDEAEEEEDASSDGGSGSSPPMNEDFAWQDPVGHSDSEYNENDQGSQRARNVDCRYHHAGRQSSVVDFSSKE